eukprot:Colp12_sorted_trinity150504_noHs@17990
MDLRFFTNLFGGRTKKEWAQFAGFYLVFYIALAAFMTACMAILLTQLPSIPESAWQLGFPRQRTVNKPAISFNSDLQLPGQKCTPSECTRAQCASTLGPCVLTQQIKVNQRRASESLLEISSTIPEDSFLSINCHTKNPALSGRILFTNTVSTSLGPVPVPNNNTNRVAAPGPGLSNTTAVLTFLPLSKLPFAYSFDVYPATPLTEGGLSVEVECRVVGDVFSIEQFRMGTGKASFTFTWKA